MKVLSKNSNFTGIDEVEYLSKFPDYHLKFYLLVEDVEESDIMVSDFYSDKFTGLSISDAKSTIFDTSSANWKSYSIEIGGYSIISINTTEIQSYSILNTIEVNAKIEITVNQDNCCFTKVITLDDSSNNCSP